jgi:hypothetical protein
VKNILKSPAFRVAFAMLLIVFVFAISVYAQTDPATAPTATTSAGKAVAIAIAVAGVVQALKAGINSFYPSLIKGRVALIFSVVGTLAAYLGTVGIANVTWTQLLLGVFSSSGVFAALQAAVKGQPAQ